MLSEWTKFREDLLYEKQGLVSADHVAGLPRWKGERVSHGTLLLLTSCGLGDALQNLRYASLAQQRVQRAVLGVP